MRVKLGLTGLLAALLVAGIPGASSAGSCTAFTAGYRSAEAPVDISAEAQAKGADRASGDSVFKLACNSCGNCGYGSYYSEQNPLDAFDVVVHLPHVTPAGPDHAALAESPTEVQEAFARWQAQAGLSR